MIEPSRKLALEQLEIRETPATLVALTNTRQLLTFDSAQPTVILNTAKLTGIPATDFILGIDSRPSTGLLYAATTKALYSVDPNTGLAKRVSLFTSTRPARSYSGFDFNPTVDRLRITNSSRQNIGVNPDPGSVTVDTALAYQTGDINAAQRPAIVASAYNNPDNNPGTTTALFGIDYLRNTLVSQVDPNAGTLSTIGPLGVDVSHLAGFDIAPGTPNSGFAALSTAAKATVSNLYTIDLTTGAATLVGGIGLNKTVVGLAVMLPAQPIYAVTTNNQLVTFNAAAPEIITSTRPVGGLLDGEKLTGIDFRPATGELYATSDKMRLYTINLANGIATHVNGSNFNGGQFGVDFNPVADALRVVSDNDQNLRIVGGGLGTTNTDTALAYIGGDPNFSVNPNVAAAAYTNNFVGATTTTLFGIDTARNVLVRQGGVDGVPSPSQGTLTTVGPLGVTVDGSDLVGFDISSGGTALAVLRLSGAPSSSFFNINLTTGAAIPLSGVSATNTANAAIIGSLAGGSPLIVGMAVAPPTVRLQKVTHSVAEKIGTVRVVVLRGGDTTATATVNYNMLGETAIPPTDFNSTPGAIVYDPGETALSFDVTINDDTIDEPNETIALFLSKDPTARFTIEPSFDQAVLTILDDDR